MTETAWVIVGRSGKSRKWHSDPHCRHLNKLSQAGRLAEKRMEIIRLGVWQPCGDCAE